MWQVHLDKENWKKSTCNCAQFQKNYICKHIVLLAIRFNLCNIPPQVKNIPLGHKPKRGRISKSKKALDKQ